MTEEKKREKLDNEMNQYWMKHDADKGKDILNKELDDYWKQAQTADEGSGNQMQA
jgi:hypothetical protein